MWLRIQHVVLLTVFHNNRVRSIWTAGPVRYLHVIPRFRIRAVASCAPPKSPVGRFCSAFAVRSLVQSDKLNVCGKTRRKRPRHCRTSIRYTQWVRPQINIVLRARRRRRLFTAVSNGAPRLLFANVRKIFSMCARVRPVPSTLNRCSSLQRCS